MADKAGFLSNICKPHYISYSS